MTRFGLTPNVKGYEALNVEGRRYQVYMAGTEATFCTCPKVRLAKGPQELREPCGHMQAAEAEAQFDMAVAEMVRQAQRVAELYAEAL